MAVKIVSSSAFKWKFEPSCLKPKIQNKSIIWCVIKRIAYRNTAQMNIGKYELQRQTNCILK